MNKSLQMSLMDWRFYQINFDLINFDRINSGQIDFFPNLIHDHPAKGNEERTFMCDACGKAFHKKGQLERHAETHTEGTPYECDVCQKK